MDIKITRMNLAQHPVVTASGNVTVAYFDLDLGPFTVTRCSLVKRRAPHDDLKVYPPSARIHGERGGVSFRDYELRHEVNRRAVAMYALQVGEEEVIR